MEVRHLLLSGWDPGCREGRPAGRTAVERRGRAVRGHLIEHAAAHVLPPDQAVHGDGGGGRRESLTAKIERWDRAVVGDILAPADDGAFGAASEAVAIRHQVLRAARDVVELEVG